MLDNLSVAIIWGRLVAVAEEVAGALERTAYSPAVREGRDFSTALFDARGRLLAQANRSPGHLGSMPGSVGHMLEVYPREQLEPGDVVVLNDPYLGSGHLPDFFGMSPVFVGDSLVGFVVSTIHLADIGGMHPGSQGVVGVTELYQEGLRLLPVKLYHAGQPDEAVFRIIEANVRVPEMVIGDIHAQRNGLFVGARNFAKIVERYGIKTVDAAADIFLDRSETAIRSEIAKIPDGSYSFSDYLDDVGPGTDPVRLEVTVHVKGDEITYDFTGSDPQTPSSINSTLSYTRAYCYWITKAITTKDTIPQNEGQLRPVRVEAPQGCFFNPIPPAAVGARAFLNQRIVELIFGALAQAIPERATAANGQWVNPIFSGMDPETGRRFVFYDYIMGGIGARHSLDGVSALSPVFSLKNTPIEAQEARYPILVERLELIQDSGGAGRKRGGLSLRKDIRMLADHVHLSNLTDRHRIAPYGLEDGFPGPLGRTVLNPNSPEEKELHSKDSHILKQGDVISFQCSGSGGFGPPGERSAAIVREDVLDEYVSKETAQEIYGFSASLGTEPTEVADHGHR